MKSNEPKYKFYRCIINSFFFLKHHVNLHGTRFKNKKILINNTIRCLGKNNRIVFEKGGIISNCKITFAGNNNLLVIKKDANAFNIEFVIEDNNNTIEIGEKTSICGPSHLACIEGTKIIIKNDSLISSNVQFRTGDSHSILDRNGIRTNKAKDIIIGEHVWICNSCILLKGTKINDDSVIGAGSIVNSQFEKTNILIAGNPAKTLKENINWDEKRT